MKHLRCLAATAFALAALSMPAIVEAKTPKTHCRPLGKGKPELLQLKAGGWQIANQAERDRFILALVDCNGDADPELRDGIAFEATQHYLRNRLASEAAMVQLSEKLQSQLKAPDRLGFRRPFAALNLAEVARADRVKAYLEPAQRARLVTSAVDYMRSINDYRGFDAVAGYRHAVAHAADLLMQLTLNPAVERPELLRMRDAIAIQVAPAGASYVTGESERLARPILFMAQRGLFSEQEWQDWLEQFSGPGPLGSWEKLYQSEAGLARRHNVTAFLSAIHVNAQASGTPALAPLAKASLEALKKLP